MCEFTAAVSGAGVHHAAVDSRRSRSAELSGGKLAAAGVMSSLVSLCSCDSTSVLHLKDKGRSFEDNNVDILDREDRWFGRGVKEAIYVIHMKPTLNRGGGFGFPLSNKYKTVFSFFFYN